MSACVEWQGYKDRRGYGREYFNGKTHMAHRVAYQRAIGPIPAGLVVMHACDNPSCVNPEHLSTGTVADNNADRDRKGRQARLKGELNGNAIISKEQAQKIVEDPRKYPEIADEYGVSIATVGAIKVGRLWTEIDRTNAVRSRAQAKLSEQQARLVFADTRSRPAIAADFGISVATVAQIKTGRTWRWIHAR